MQLCLTMIFLPNLPKHSSVFVQGFEAPPDMVSIIAKLSASHGNYSTAKRSKRISAVTQDC